MPDDNGRLRNIEEWIRKLDSKSDAILEKMGTLASTAQVVSLEKRTRHLEIDLPALTGPGSGLVYAASWFMGNSSPGTMISGAGGR
jgi:hypothetical protein